MIVGLDIHSPSFREYDLSKSTVKRKEITMYRLKRNAADHRSPSMVRFRSSPGRLLAPMGGKGKGKGKGKEKGKVRLDEHDLRDRYQEMEELRQEVSWLDFNP